MPETDDADDDADDDEDQESEPDDIEGLMDQGYFDGSDCDFADPGGTSVLRAAGPGNPRNLPCPTCGAKDRLTPKDVALGYQCDSCADALEQGGP